jgi:hypothetical protein
MIKNFIFTFFVLLSGVSDVSSQNTLAIDWEYSFGGSRSDFGKKALQTPQGDYVFLGYGVTAPDGDIPAPILATNIYLTKFSKDGVKKWAKRLGRKDGPPANSVVDSEAYDFCQTNDGGFLIVGTEWSASDGDSSFVIKVDSVGNQQWRKTFTAVYRPWAIRKRDDGNYLLGAMTGNNVVTVAGLDAAGNITWLRNATGVANESATDLEPTKDGGFVISGICNTPRIGKVDAFIASFSADNQTRWVKRYGDSIESDQLLAIEEDKDGNLWAGGFSYASYDSARGELVFSPNGKGTNAWLIKTDRDGNPLWQKTWEGDWNERIQTLTLTADGNVAVGGYALSTSGDFRANINGHRTWVARANKMSGELVRQGWFGGRNYEDGVKDMFEDTDGNLVFISTVYANNPYVSDFKGGDNDMWLVKLRNQANALHATIYLDNNKNGKKDDGEPPFQRAYLKLKRSATDSVRYWYDNSSFTISIDSGRYDVSLIPFRPFYTITPPFSQVHFIGYGGADSVEFGVVPVPGIVDLSVSAWSSDRVRMGRNTTIRIKYANQGTQTTNCVLRIVKDRRADFISSPLAFTRDGDTLSINITDLKPEESRETFITLAIKTPPWLIGMIH